MHRVEKVHTYITQGEWLLGFSHVDFSDSGSQVPGGTIKAGETPEATALCEAGEETGLKDLVVNEYLGKDQFLDTSTMPNRILVRHFFYLVSPHEIPETWQHHEDDPSEGVQRPILFEFTWLPLREADGYLGLYFTAMLGKLIMEDNEDIAR
jgi:8-oxo-dGTP pyrophosphatase MutT (NUDIX family)